MSAQSRIASSLTSQASACSLFVLVACAGQGSHSTPGGGKAPEVVTTKAPSIQGTITQKIADRVLIESEPLDSFGSDKASVRITGATSVVHSSGEPAGPEDLQVGQKVSAWFEGPVMESYPVQATAAALRIDTEGAENEMSITGVVRFLELEGGVFVIRTQEGETYNPTNLPEEFRQDGLPVEAKIRLREDMVSIHQVGPIVEIVEIRKR